MKCSAKKSIHFETIEARNKRVKRMQSSTYGVWSRWNGSVLPFSSFRIHREQFEWCQEWGGVCMNACSCRRRGAAMGELTTLARRHAIGKARVSPWINATLSLRRPANEEWGGGEIHGRLEGVFPFTSVEHDSQVQFVVPTIQTYSY